MVIVMKRVPKPASDCALGRPHGSSSRANEISCMTKNDKRPALPINFAALFDAAVGARPDLEHHSARVPNDTSWIPYAPYDCAVQQHGPEASNVTSCTLGESHRGASLGELGGCFSSGLFGRR